MNRIMILATALMVVVAGMAVAPVEAEAGLFNRNKCCKPQKCRKSRRSQQCCPQTTCCAPAPAPTCCEPAPAPCGCAAAPAPSCGCEAASTCGCEAAPSCGCEVVSTCGCEAAPSCGCETDCNCLSRRELRRANRKGQCCGAKANSCNTCSAPVSTCGCSAPISTCGAEIAVEGCSTCNEAAPAPAEGEEAAPEAPTT